jgi:hypothetical protein
MSARRDLLIQLGWLAALSVLTAARPAAADPIFVVESNRLSQFDSATPEILRSTIPLTGLVAGDVVVGIDFRPATGQLYGFAVDGAAGRLYTIETETGIATPVGDPIPLPQSAGAMLDSSYGFDFNPVSDQIRVVNIFQDNFRLNPDTGAVVSADTALSVIFISAIAYDRNAPGLGVTTLYGINSGASDALVTQGGIDGMPSPNGGVIMPIGSLGVDTTVTAALDIAPPSRGGTAYAALFIVAMGGSHLFTVDLTTGQATLVGPIGPGTLSIGALAVAPPAPAGAPAVSPWGLVVVLLGLGAFGWVRLSRRLRVA